jgi:site-specific recombinase XerD
MSSSRRCSGKTYDDRRDTAIIRLWCEPGSARVSEMARIALDDLDMRLSLLTLHGKGDKSRKIRFGDKTGTALDRFLRERKKHKLVGKEGLWLGARGASLTSSGLYQMLERRSIAAGIGRVHPHQLRHTAAHDFKVRGGSDDEAMALFGWESPAMPLVYGRSARVERALQASRRMSPADRL